MDTLNNNLLELARSYRGLPQKEAAFLIGISQGKLSKAEKGVQSLNEDLIEKAAKVYGFPVSFFYLPRDTSPISHFYFRRKQTTSAKSLDMFKASVKIQKMAIDTLMGAIDRPTYNLPSLKPSATETPEDIARKIRFLMKVPSGPIASMTALLELNGIIIQRFDFGTDDYDGLATITAEGNRVIFLNSRLPADRTRFSLAHELGHMVMHIDFIPENEEEAEKQAHRFASEFLMPLEESRDFLWSVDLYNLKAIKQTWGMSMQSIIYKAHAYGFISDAQSTNFYKAFSRRGWLRKEPNPLQQEFPTVIKDTLSLYRSELGYDTADLMCMVHLSDINDFTRWFVTNNYCVNIRMTTQSWERT